MVWNWQARAVPPKIGPVRLLETAERQFLVSGGVSVGTVRHVGKEERHQLTIEAMSTEAVATSEIEGEAFRQARPEG